MAPFLRRSALVKDMKLKLTLVKHPHAHASQQMSVLFDHSGGSIGRSDDCQLTLHCQEKIVSRLHAKITFEKEQFFITDVSANGLYLNANPTAVVRNVAMPVDDDTVIKIGSFELSAKVITPEINVEPDSIEPIIPGPKPIEPIEANVHHSTDSAASGSVSSNPLASLDDIDAALSGKPLLPDTPNAREFMDSAPAVPDFSWDSPPKKSAKKVSNEIIPDDWNMPFSFDKEPSLKVDAKPKFNQSDNKGLEHFLKGMGLDKDISADQLTPETLENIGRTLRTAINGVMASRQWLFKAKVGLCDDRKVLDKYGEVDALDHIDDIDTFMQTLVDRHSRHQLALVADLAQYFKESIEDMSAIYETIDEAVQQSASATSPETIATIAHDKDPRVSPWDYYQQNTDEFKQRAFQGVRRQFEARVLALHGTRSQNNKKREY